MHILGPEESKIYIWECIYVQKEIKGGGGQRVRLGLRVG